MNSFIDQLHRNFELCTWSPHTEFSNFTGRDSDFYLQHKEAFVTKYRWMWAVAKTINPHTMIELGVYQGASADAYISASGCSYIGIDYFPFPDVEPFVLSLFLSRGFSRWLLVKEDLRNLHTLPYADLIVVDAEHDYENQKADIELALSARPKWIFIDDARGEQTEKAIHDVMQNFVNVECHWIDYICAGGLVWKLWTT